MRIKGRLLFLLLSAVFSLSCKSTPGGENLPRGGGFEAPKNGEGPSRPGTGIAEEIRLLTETGVLSSMLGALELIRQRELGSSEFGRVMNGVNTTLIKRLYPDTASPLPALDLPQTHLYARILREAERGNYAPPAALSTDYLEYVLPFLAVFSETRAEPLLAAMPDLEKARSLRPDSVLAPYFQGLVLERTGRLAEAEAVFTQTWEISPECYPAMLGLVRIQNRQGRRREAMGLLQDLVIRYPDSQSVKRQLAIAYYENGDWSRAEQAVAEILQRDSRDGEFILMRAHILVEQGQYAQAQAPLDQYAAVNPNSRLYLLLRAKVQALAYRNRDSALNYLRSILRVNPNDDEASVYAASLLMESQRAPDQAEGREILARLLSRQNQNPVVLSLGLQDAIRRESWSEARNFLGPLLESRRSVQDLLNAYTVERGLGNNARALSYARELYQRDPANDEALGAYISALIDTRSNDEASRMIENRLASAPGGQAKSRYYFLRSRIRTGEEGALSDLRSSLFEDPRNLNALIAMFEIYHRRREERRAVYYLKQALAIAPENPRLKRYEAEYSGLLGGY